jgi:antitoxin VapB
MVESVVTMNIKNPEAHRLAKELACLKGETITTAVIVALRERLEREAHGRSSREGVAARLMQIARDYQSQMTSDFRDLDPDELLYDDLGLPK